MNVDPGAPDPRLAELRTLVGTQVAGSPETVERNDIRDFAEAIRWPAEPLPRYVDERHARRTRAGGIIAPPTYLSRLARVGGYSLPMPVPEWWPGLPGILASVEIDQDVPLRPGDTIRSLATIVDVVAHVTPRGTLVGIVRDFEFSNQLDERVGRTRRTIAKFLDAPLFDRVGLDDPIGGHVGPPEQRSVDEAIQPFCRQVTFMALNRFAGANREWGLYHMDSEFARSLGLSGALVLEHLKLAYLANMLEDWLGEDGRIASIGASFLSLDIVGATLTAHGLSRGPTSGSGPATDCDIWIEDESRRAGTIGAATLVGL